MEKTKPYIVYWEDNTYRVFDLTPEDYDSLETSLRAGDRYARLSIGILSTSGIRFIVEQREPETVKEKPALPNLTPEECRFIRETLSEIYGREDE